MSMTITLGDTPCPAGIHKATCARVEDNGTVETQYGPKHKVTLTWQVVAGPLTQTFEVRRRYTWSLHEKSTLRQHLDAWVGPLTPDQLAKGVDLEQLVGTVAQIQITHTVKGDRTWADVEGVTKDPDLTADEIPF